MGIVITGARAELPDGTVVAYIERMKIGGGSRIQVIDGVDHELKHEAFERFHVRKLSQAGPLVPDELDEAETYEQACKLAEAFIETVLDNAEAIAELKKKLAGGGQ